MYVVRKNEHFCPGTKHFGVFNDFMGDLEERDELL